MIALSAPSILPIGGCTGFVLTDNTDYAQAPTSADFNLGRFYLGLRLINVTYPDGVNKIFCTYNSVNESSVQVNIDQSYNTTIPNVIPSAPETWQFYSTKQGVFTVNIVSVPLSTYGFTSTPIATTFQTGDIVFAFLLGQYVLYQALVNNPDNNLLNTGEWQEVVLLDNFQIVPFANQSATPVALPSNYVNTVTITNDCYLSNLECIIQNLSCAFCCGKCDDILVNKNAVAIIKASLLVSEIQTTEAYQRYSYYNTPGNQTVRSTYTPYASGINSPAIPYSNSLIQLVCNYSNAISKICQCNDHQPCSPCSEDVVNTQPQIIYPAQIANAMNAIIDSGFVYNLKAQVTLGKTLCCDDRKTLLVFLVANVLSNEKIPVSPQSYDCLSQTLDIDQSENTSIIVSSSGNLFSNNFKNLMLSNIIPKLS